MQVPTSTELDLIGTDPFGVERQTHAGMVAPQCYCVIWVALTRLVATSIKATVGVQEKRQQSKPWFTGAVATVGELELDQRR